MEERKVVSTEKITCRELGEEHEAVLVVFENGDIEVHCECRCGKDCPYGYQVDQC